MTHTLILGIGYIGSALCAYWNQEGARHIFATTTSETKARALSVKCFVLKGNNRTELAQALEGVEHVVISIAPKKGVSYEETYLETAKSVCSVLETNNSVTHVVYLSSTSVYGERKGAWVSEDSVVKPETENAQVLCETESVLLKRLESKVSLSVLRLGGIYGPERSHEMRMEHIAGKTLPGSGEAYSNWVHQEDVVRAIDWVLKKQLSGIYNVCSDDHPTKKELYDAIADKVGVPKVEWDPSVCSPHGGNRRVSNEKIKETGFVFLHQCAN